MSEIKNYGATLDDFVDANRIEKSLSTVGVTLFDTNGEMRNLDDVLIEVGKQWDNLNKKSTSIFSHYFSWYTSTNTFISCLPKL